MSYGVRVVMLGVNLASALMFVVSENTGGVILSVALAGFFAWSIFAAADQ